MLAEQSLAVLLVLDRDGQPFAILPGKRVLRCQALPEYVVDDPLLTTAVRGGADAEIAELIAPAGC
ncbi:MULTISPECIES: hypothetical protein [Streptomyces]|uniref:Uncharacterized protein n=1 Tax=Streptomyces fimbriatus TaxID=68197 RepID=A0ABW0DE06_STRFI